MRSFLMLYHLFSITCLGPTRFKFFNNQYLTSITCTCLGLTRRIHIRGTSNIEALIKTRLPPRKYGPGYARHRMESAADIDDLTVVTPAGERCRFSIEVDTLHEGSQSRMVIRNLVREIL